MTTRANLESEVVSRIGAWMSNVGFAVAVAGSNANLNSPIGWAIRTSGGSTSDPALVTDADVATVAVSSYDQLTDLAELRTLEAIYKAYTGVDVKGLSFSESGDQFAQRIWQAITALRSSIEGVYGIGGHGAFAVTLTRTDGYSDLAALDT